jgi:hypothetical protein
MSIMDVDDAQEYMSGFVEGKLQLAANENISLGYARHCAAYPGFSQEFRRGFVDALSLKFGTDIFLKEDWNQ